MNCPHCHDENEPSATFCSGCGARLQRACPECGEELRPTARFCDACGTSLENAARNAAREVAPPALQPREERRWATVLFADLSGFTAIAERMDPEDVKALAHRCAERLAVYVRRFGGTVITFAGDQVGAVFGAPLSHEDDAERAVRAALAMQECPLSDDPAQPIPVHIGINTGEVMAGRVGPEERRDYTVMGDVVNTAARLMSAAAAGSVLVGEETCRATRRVVRYREAAKVSAKGKERPVSAWEALEVVAVPEARPLGTAPLVGRDEEMALLTGIWERAAQQGRPHLVTVIGEPGIGKSRLVAEFERRALGKTRVIHGRCLPYSESLGYGALSMALKEGAEIGAEDDAEGARARLGRLVETALGPEAAESERRDVTRHLALLSGVDLAADRAGNPTDQRTLHARVCRFLEALARRRPLCVMLEDIHWADDALLELIEFVASRARDAPLLIVTQARPQLLEKRPAWGRDLHAFTALPLQPLAERAGRDLIRALCRDYGLEEEVVEPVGRGAGGNPLFAEELVAMLAERGRGAGIPAMIQALISARLDTLRPEERSALQLAAVFGKAFWESGLRALGVPGEVGAILQALETKDLLRAQPRSQFRGSREYAFKHDLIRDVAYETLPRAARRSLHGRAADWIEQSGGEQVEESLHLLAHHAVEAQQQERALGYLRRAAARSHRVAAHREEAALLAQAIGLAEQIGEQALIADLHAQRGTAFARLSRWPEARGEMEAALAHMAPERREDRAQVLSELAGVCFWGLDGASMRRYATDAVELADQAGRGDLAGSAMGWLAVALQMDGELHAGIDLHRRAITRAGGLRVATLANAPLTYYLSGQYQEALRLSREAVPLIRRLNDTSATMFGLPHLGLALAATGHYAEALETFEETRRFGREYAMGSLLARATAMSAGFHLDLFDFTANEARAEEARELARSVAWPPSEVSAGIDLLLNFARRREVGRAERLLPEVTAAAERVAGWHAWLWELRLAEARAEIALARGDWEEARRWADAAIAKSRLRHRVKYQVAGLGTRAQALAAIGRKKAAIADLRSAVEIARPVGDPALFLRPATALLAIDGSDGLAAEARAVAHRILAALPDEGMRRRFADAEPVRLLGRLSP